MRRFLLALALVLLAAAVAGAQGVEWDSLGNPYTGPLTALAFLPGPAPDGSADTLFTGGTGGAWRYPPGGPFSQNLDPFTPANHVLLATATGALLSGGAPGWAIRSTNGGRTWAMAYDDNVTVLYQTTLPALGGAVLAGLSILFRSYADGAAGTWEQLSSAGGEFASLAEVEPSAALPSGRLLAGVWNGAAYSDDGGATWVRSSLWQGGRYVVNSLAFHPDPAHPYGGVAYAGVRDFGAGGGPGVWRSEDGGVTWALMRAFEDGAFGLSDPNWAVVAVAADGVVWAGIHDVEGGSAPDPGTVVRSTDGGVTWTEAADGYGRWGVRALLFGRDGRLYAATDEGVWRTATPVVSAEPGPGEASGVRLEVRPNPSSGSVTLALTLPEASGAVRVGVYDVLGREVAVVHEGPLAAGAHRLAVEAASLAPGVYVVRGVTEGGTVTARLVAVR